MGLGMLQASLAMSVRPSLPLLQGRKDELSKCAFCPKLCRATCVVSETAPREVLTPGGKMSSVFDAARTEQLDGEQAELAWACSNCFRCREACDHRNSVTETLNDARADYLARGHAPTGVRAVLARRPAIEAKHRAAVQVLRDQPGVRADAPDALLLGCRYAQVLPDEARAAIRLAVRLLGSVRLLSGCCGAWQRAAGAPDAALAAEQQLALELADRPRLLVLDPRCALQLSAFSATSLVELCARYAGRFRTGRFGSQRFRYHDSCALGRGLGLYDEPRQLLAQVTGEVPHELSTQRAHARCSGGGGLLPVSMPDVARIAAARLGAEHAELGGGTLVTSCASSLSQLRGVGAPVVDLIALLERGLRVDD